MDSSVLAGIPIGMGILMIFMQGLNYIIGQYYLSLTSVRQRTRIIYANVIVKRCVPHVRQLRHRRKHLLAFPGRRRLPAVRHADVSYPGCGLGDQPPRFLDHRYDSRSYPVLYIRGETKEDEPV